MDANSPGCAADDRFTKPLFSNRWIVLAGVVVIEITMVFGLLPWKNFDHIRNTDFVNFYAAATIVRDGNGPHLYGAETQDPVLYSILGRSSRDYFLHPPFLAGILVPFTYLKIQTAFILWTLLNMILLGVMPLLLAECVGFVARRPSLGLLSMLFLPILTALTLGQDSILLAFVLTLTYALLSKKRNLAAGVVLAVATLKFQYAFVIVGLMLVNRRYRLVAGFAFGCSVLLALSLYVTGFSGLANYVKFVYDYNSSNGFGTLHVSQMVNARGFLTGLGFVDHAQSLSILASMGFLCLGIFVVLRLGSLNRPGLLFSFAAAVALLASPYAFFPDLSILICPLYLAWDNARSAKPAFDRLAIMLSCVLVFLLPLLLIALGGHYWWNSRIYLMFPALCCFLVVVAVGLLRANATLARSDDQTVDV